MKSLLVIIFAISVWLIFLTFFLSVVAWIIVLTNPTII